MKLIITVVFLFVATNAFSQSFGIKAGLNHSNVFEENNNGEVSNDYKLNIGINIGFAVEFLLNENLFIEGNIFLNNKGYKLIDKEPSLEWEVERLLNLYYIDISSLIKYSFPFNQLSIFGTIGPYFGVGVDGQIKHNAISYGMKMRMTNDIKWGDKKETSLDEGIKSSFWQ